MKKTKNSNGVVLHLIITAVLGVVFWIIGELLFPVFTEKMWTPLGISLYFLIFAVLIMIAFFIISVSKVDASKKEIKRNIKDGYVICAVIMVVIVLLSCLFEFLYELGDQDTYENTSYVFLIDDSGSMDGTEEIRINAIKEVMENSDMNKPYTVYKFADSAVQMKPMEYYNIGDEESLVFESIGGTEILGSIETVIKDLKNGNLNNAGSYPKIFLVSDGASSSLGLRSVAKNCRNNGVTVSTIGVEGCAESLLQKIADNTGGVFVRCDDVSLLSESFEKAKSVNTDRNLLSERFVFKNDGLYAFLRILFLGLLGLAWSLAKSTVTFEDKLHIKKNIIFSLICCTLGTLIIELFFGVLNIKVLRLIFCVLWALTYGTFNTSKKKSDAKYGVAGDFQSGFTDTTNASAEERLASEKEKNALTRGISFDGAGINAENQSSVFGTNPFAENSNVPGKGFFGTDNAGFTPDIFNGNKSSAPFGNESSNPFGE